VYASEKHADGLSGRDAALLLCQADAFIRRSARQIVLNADHALSRRTQTAGMMRILGAYWTHILRPRLRLPPLTDAGVHSHRIAVPGRVDALSAPSSVMESRKDN